MTPEVKAAVEELERQYTGRVLAVPDKAGGAMVIVEDEPLGDAFSTSSTWIGFHVTEMCPYADTYPHFVRGDLSRRDGRPLGDALSPGQKFPPIDALADPSAMPQRDAVQISRRSNRREASGLETPLIKLLKVLLWLRDR